MDPAKIKFNECINEINKLKIQEVIEGSVSEKQILFFIEYLIQNPNIKNILDTSIEDSDLKASEYGITIINHPMNQTNS